MKSKAEKKGNNYFPGWMLYTYFFHLFQAGYALKRYTYIKNMYGNIDVSDIEDIHKYFIEKNSIV